VRSTAADRERSLGFGLVGPLIQVLLLAAVYYLAARLSLRLALIQRNVTPLWPPTGIAVVAFLLIGRRAWPGVALAALAVNAPISASLPAALVTAAGNTLAPFVAAELLARVGFRIQIDRRRDVIAIVFLGALASMVISASIGAGTLVASGAIPRSGFVAAWAVWWTGDAMGVLVVAPFILSLLLLRHRSKTSWARRVEAVLLFLVITAVTLGVTETRFRLIFLVLPLLWWGAWRFQQRGAAPAALLVAGLATWAAAHGHGSFGQGTLFQKMLVLQAFNATVAFTSFFFAAMVTERIRDGEALERAAAELEERVHRRTSQLSVANEHLRQEIRERKDVERKLRQRERQLSDAQHMARVGSWEWVIPEDRITWSDEMYRIHGHRAREFGVTFERALSQVLPDDLERIKGNLEAAVAKGTDHSLAPSEYRIVRPDGAERVLLGKSRLAFGRGSPDGGDGAGRHR
jgi:integral membrane sensor domain MASE1